jgi:acyl carrier protein
VTESAQASLSHKQIVTSTRQIAAEVLERPLREVLLKTVLFWTDDTTTEKTALLLVLGTKLEEAFGITIADDMLTLAKTVKDLCWIVSLYQNHLDWVLETADTTD